MHEFDTDHVGAPGCLECGAVLDRIGAGELVIVEKDCDCAKHKLHAACKTDCGCQDEAEIDAVVHRLSTVRARAGEHIDHSVHSPDDDDVSRRDGRR